jgi:D-alanine-D-alanine ligase
MRDKIRLGILMGGSSFEREISYRSAENIANSLDKTKYDVTKYDVPEDGSTAWITSLTADRPDIVLNALHGGNGEDGGVQGLLNCLGIPFVGSDVTASAICMDKALCKELMRAASIPVADGVSIKRNESLATYEETIGGLGFPLIVKPNKGGSSLGINVVNNMDELRSAVYAVFEDFADDAIVERYIDGKEVTCAVLQGENGAEVISLLDINKQGGIFDYTAKYEGSIWSGGISNLPRYMQDMINGIAKKAFTMLGCSGYACVDMILDEEQIYVIEVNTLPGMTEKSLIPNAVKAVGSDLGSFLDKLIDLECEV